MSPKGDILGETEDGDWKNLFAEGNTLGKADYELCKILNDRYGIWKWVQPQWEPGYNICTGIMCK